MPLFNGKPIIQRGTRGPAPRWRNPRKPAKTIIHVNTHKIKENQKQNLQQPVITVKTRCNPSQVSLPTLDAETKVKTNFDSLNAVKGGRIRENADPTAARKSQNVNLYGHEVEILGGCRVVYRPNNPKCGAKVWIETLYDVKVFCWD